MKSRWQNKLANNLALQMITVVAIISAGFYFVSQIQAQQIQKRLSDKAELYSTILGSNVDKIVGDNLVAYSQLQDAALLAVQSNQAIEKLNVLSPEGVILASNDPEKVWQTTEKKYVNMVSSIKDDFKPKSFIQTEFGQEAVVHFMPLFEGAGDQQKLIGVLDVRAGFASQQGQLMASIRANKRAYFRKEAVEIAKSISGDLQRFLGEAQRNFGYLDQLIQNMISDKDITDIQLFHKDLGVVISGNQGGGVGFLAAQPSLLQAQALERQKAIVKSSQDQQDALRIASPLYVKQGNQSVIVGAVEVGFSLKRIHGLILKSRNSLVVMNLVIVCVFCLVLGLFFKQRIFSPVRELIGITKHVSQDDLSKRSKVHFNDEIGQLAEAFNQMLDELQHSKAEIEHWNLQLKDRVRQVSDELLQKQGQLAEAEKIASLGTLSSGIAHEINNPLGIMLGHSQLLLNELKEKGKLSNPKEAQVLLETIEDHTRRCSHIVKSLLQFARKRELQFAKTNVNKSIENALLFISNRLEKKHIEVVEDLQENLPLINADGIQLEQVFINLFMNAVESMDEEGKLTITTEAPFTTEVSVVVKDTGSGIPPEYSSKIFEPFFTARKDGEGVGLGLSVSYGIVKAHKGDIDIQSEAGKGTTVTVKLPVEKG